MAGDSDGDDRGMVGTGRRSFLGLSATLGLGGLADLTRSIDLVTTGSNLEASDDANPPQTHPYPEDPFMQPSFGGQFLAENEWAGYPDRSRSEKLRTVGELHPDVLAFDQLSSFEDGELDTHRGYAAQLSVARALDRPATSGWNVNIHVGENADGRYEPILEAHDWRYPDGTALESPQGIAGELWNGEPHIQDFEFATMVTPSVFAQGGLDLLVLATEERLREGYAGFFVDGVGIFRNEGLDFSRWKQAAFRDHLESLAPERLTELGIEDPSSFDIRDHIKSEKIAPWAEVNPFTDPVFREYVIHQHIGIDEWYDRYRAAIEERFPDRMADGEIALYANQFTGHFGTPQAPNVYVSDSLDVIYTELFPRVDPAVDVNYKFMDAVGNFSKPVIAKGTIAHLGADETGDISPTTPNPMFTRFQVAEAFACGARMQMPLTARFGYSVDESVTNWVGRDGTISERLRSFADFLWAHERFLSGLDSGADVAVVFSLATRLWRHEPTWQIGVVETPRLDSFTGSAALLREAGIAYDVLVFGHPRLWDDAEQLERLTRYDAVVLPAIECITDGQLTALESYVEDGGALVNSGPLPDRDGFYEPRDVSGLFAGERVTTLQSDPGLSRERGDPVDESLADALAEMGVRPRRLTDDQSVAIHRYVQPDTDREIVQLVNYDYDDTDDSFAEKTGLTVRPDTAPEDAVAARFYSPQQQVPVELSAGSDGLELEVPTLVEWGFVVVTTAEGAFTEGDPENARSTVETATHRLADATERGFGDTAEVSVAASLVSAAETALEYEAYPKATETATEALETIETAVPSPTPTPETTPTYTASPQASPTATDSPSPTASPPETTGQRDESGSSPTSGQSPGFGVMGGLAAIAVGAWRLLRRDDQQ